MTVTFAEQLRAILRRPKRAGYERTDREQDILKEAVRLMVEHKQAAKVTDQNIAVLSYLARNPGAIIVADKYTVAAFDAAKRAVEIEEQEEWQCKREVE